MNEQREWLKEQASSQGEAVAESLLIELGHRVDGEDFVQMITQKREELPQMDEEQVVETPAMAAVESDKPLCDVQDDIAASYVMVEHADVAEAMAEFLASYLVMLPESVSMNPGELQKLVKKSLEEIQASERKTGLIQAISRWVLYIVTSASAAVITAAYQNIMSVSLVSMYYTAPWVVKAIIKTVMSCLKAVAK
jgi:hypothetical protein